MSKVAELYTEVSEMLEKSTHPATISAVLDVPISWVYEVLDEAKKPDEDFSPFKTVNS